MFDNTETNIHPCKSIKKVKIKDILKIHRENGLIGTIIMQNKHDPNQVLMMGFEDHETALRAMADMFAFHDANITEDVETFEKMLDEALSDKDESEVSKAE